MSCLEMMKHEFFQENDFAVNFLETLKQKIEKETATNPLLKSLAAHKDSHDNMKLDKDKKDKKRKEVKEHLPKTPHELKNKQKHIQHSESQASVPHYPSIFSIDNKKTVKAGVTIDDKKRNADNQNTDKNNNASSPKSTDKSSPVGKQKSLPSEFDRSDTKLNLRTPLDVSINMPGKNLPGLSNTTPMNRYLHVFLL